jgi:hypothetical protein
MLVTHLRGFSITAPKRGMLQRVPQSRARGKAEGLPVETET